MGRWRRHIYQGVADTVERQLELEPERCSKRLGATARSEAADITGCRAPATSTSRSPGETGRSGQKYGGRFEGIIPSCCRRYRTSKSKMQRRQLEKYMCVVRCAACDGARLNPQARSVTLTTRHAEIRRSTQPFAARSVCIWRSSDAAEFFSELELDATRP